VRGSGAIGTGTTTGAADLGWQAAMATNTNKTKNRVFLYI
jgi:hypothetical protein